MVNVIDKAFLILERIAVSAPVPMLPTQIADELNLNRATCSRLLKQLMDMGYLLKVSRQQGYVPGPKFLTMGNLARFQQDFLMIAGPVIDRCAEDLQASVLTAQLYHGKRYVLYHKNLSPELDIRITQPCFDDIFETATGVLLIAHSSAEEQIRCFRDCKRTEHDTLSGFSTEQEMMETLDQVVKQGFVFSKKQYQWVYAYPISRNGAVFAALGASIGVEQHSVSAHERICRVLQDSAAEISRKLTPKYTIG